MKRIILSAILAMALLPAFAQNKSLLNLDKSGIAIQGYDPVAFFTDSKPVKGDTKFVTKRDGAVYLFVSKEHKEMFTADPAKYEPAFGGYCAYGVSRNKLVEIDPEAFQVVSNRLLLQYSKSVRDTFNKDTKGNLSKADTNWPGLLDKNGK
jgi:YHS domain-containing protein